MNVRQPVSRRRFFGGMAATAGVLGLSRIDVFAQARTQQFSGSDAEYDRYIKLASNEKTGDRPSR